MRNESQRSPLASPPPVREPDEIHIHIGRIEVTAAVPQPPARPAAARKPVNLDEYLKRAPGRSR